MICTPRFDLPTKSSSSFLVRHILPRMEPPPLIGLFARNPFFSMFVNNGDFILGSGHGTSREWAGQGESPLLVAGQYDPEQVSGKVVKLLCCDCGQELGPDLVQYGNCKASLTYSDDLLW